MNLATVKRRISKLSQATGSEVWMPNLFIWMDSEETEHEALKRWEEQNRPVKEADKICYIVCW